MTHYDPLDTVGNEERKAEAQAEADRTVEQAIEDLKWLMSDKRGRRIMWDLLALTGVFRNPFKGERNATDFRCGEMNIGHVYLGDINLHAPERYNQMVQENIKNDRRK